jgi:hypothetical protein
MEGTKQDLFKRFNDLKRWNNEILLGIKKFQSLGEHTVDVDMRMRAETKIAKRAKQEVFTRWKTFRFKCLKAHPRMLQSMMDLGNEYSYYSREASEAWKFPDSQHIRDEDPVIFKKREDIEGGIRDNLISMVELRPLSKEYTKRYGAHDNMVSDRAFRWITFIGGIVTGALAAIAAGIILNRLGIK